MARKFKQIINPKSSPCSSGPTAESETPKIIKDYREGKQVLAFSEKKGETFDTCATISEKYICCNVKVLKSVSNCPFDCSYCFLQNYLTDGTTTVIDDTEAMIAEVQEKTLKQPGRFFRIGTWELGDSLALENESRQAEKLIQAFTDVPQAILELKTKSDCVDTILGLDHQHKTVVSWSMNTRHIIDRQEHRTATLDQRLAAIEKVVDSGYLVGIHFDPMIDYPDSEPEYASLVKEIFSRIPNQQIAWISIGSLRFNPEMKRKMEENFPAANLTISEMVLGNDGKMRYPKPTRIKMYRNILDALKIAIPDLSPPTDRNPKSPILYFCMERWDMWDKLLGDHPTSIAHLDYLFADAFHKRYPHIVPQEPDFSIYEKFESE
jgi:spore photoproduct lyase